MHNRCSLRGEFCETYHNKCWSVLLFGLGVFGCLKEDEEVSGTEPCVVGATRDADCNTCECDDSGEWLCTELDCGSVLAKKMNVVHGRRFLIRSVPMELLPVSESVFEARMGPVDGVERNVRLSVSPVMRLPILMAIAAFATVLASMNVSATVMDLHLIVSARPTAPGHVQVVLPNSCVNQQTTVRLCTIPVPVTGSA